MLRNQIDARSHLQIASADHLTREMGHMAEVRAPRPEGEEGLPDIILMDAIYRAAKDRRSVSI